MKEKFIVSVVSQLVSSIVFTFAFYLLFLNLDKPSLGIWALLNSIINLGFLFINIGLDVIHYQYSGKINYADYFGTFLIIKLFVLLINVVISISLIIIISFTKFWVSDFLVLLGFLLLSKILFNIANVFFINLKSRLKIFKSEIPAFIITIGKSVSLLFVSLNISYFSEPLLFICVSIFIFDLLYLILILVFSKNEYKINKPRKDLVLLYLKDAKPLFFFSITLVLATNLGNLILDYSFGHESLANFSFINTYVIQILLVLSSSIITIYLPLFSKFFESGDIETIKRITYLIEKYSSIIFLSIIIIVLINGDLIIHIFLPQYVETIPILYIMVFIPFFLSITQPYSYHFIAGKNQKINAYINSLTRTLIIVLMIFLIPTRLFFLYALGWGEIGYAIAQTLPWIIWVFVNRYYSFKIYNISPQKSIVLHVSIASGSFLISYFIRYLILEKIILNHILILIISSTVSLGTFFGFLFVFRELKREDLRFLLQLANLKSYRDSLKKEFIKRK